MKYKMEDKFDKMSLDDQEIQTSNDEIEDCREFTHRVKSVSMAKFTSQEVEALQNGGNQRARELYLKDWDLQRQRLPDSSNVDKIREFIKNVYVERRYAGGKTTDKPPRDVQSLRSNEDEARRASSYHSYSQSPPYDYQYEDRRYGKQFAALTRKPGSDRGHYEGKMSSFVYSPGRLNEQMYEDRFANEGSVSRGSDFSVSSGGDPFRSGAESPNFRKDVGFNSPPVQTSRGSLSDDLFFRATNSSETNSKRDADGIPRPQRTASSSSFGSVESHSLSYKSYNSGGLTEVVSEPDQPAGIFQATSSAPSPASSVNVYQPPQTFPLSSLNSFPEIPQQQSATTLDRETPQISVPKNEGWATFDSPQPTASVPHAENPIPAKVPSSDVGLLEKFDPFSSLDTNIQWPSFQLESVHGPSSIMSNQWHDGLHNVQAPTIATSTPVWNAFDDSIGNLPLNANVKGSELQLETHSLSSSADQYLGFRDLEDSCKDGIQRDVAYFPPGPTEQSHVMGPSFPLMGEIQSHAVDLKSTNPFDLPNDSDLEQSNMVVVDPCEILWEIYNTMIFFHSFPSNLRPMASKNPMTPYIPAAGQGGLTYMAGQAPSSQIGNVPSQGPFSSIGGNPFA
nr:isoform 2 of probable adp-ribosylation factor gtpase-activating protein agd14 [Quercus suber]